MDHLMTETLWSEETFAFLHLLVKEKKYFACLNVHAFNVGFEKVTFAFNGSYER